MSSDNGHSISPLPVVHNPANQTFLSHAAHAPSNSYCLITWEGGGGQGGEGGAQTGGWVEVDQEVACEFMQNQGLGNKT